MPDFVKNNMIKTEIFKGINKKGKIKIYIILC